MGPGPRVHLAVLGRNDSVVRRLVASAHAGSAVLHPSLARIYEVCRFDGVAYAVADPSEGLDLAAALSAGPLPFELGLAVTSILGRVAVAIHDAAGGRGQVGFASVVSGGLSPDVVFLEPTGAVRIRPVAAAGLDPEEPTAFRAPEEAISMAADVYSLGRLLMALLSGDPRGLTMPRLSPSSPLPPLLTRMVTRRAAERPHLHEAVTRIEQVLNGRQVGAADQVVRNALGGAFRSLVVDPGLGLEAPPHVIYELRMRLPYVYAATERLWPTMNPGFAPPPAVFAAMPVSSQALLGSGDDDDADVFSDQPPRRRARTAATMRIDADELAAAVAIVDAAGSTPHQPAPTRRFRPTKKTVLIAAGAMIDEIEREAPAGDATAMLDVGELEPFATDVPPARAAPIPHAHDVYDDDDDDGAFSSSFSRPAPPARPVSPPLPRTVSPPPRPVTSPPARPPRPATHAALAVFGNAGDSPAADDWEDDDDEPLFAPTPPPVGAADVVATSVARAPSVSAAIADADRAALMAALEEDHDIDASAEDDDDDGAFGFTSGSRAPPTVVAPPPVVSDPGMRTTPRPAVETFSLDKASVDVGPPAPSPVVPLVNATVPDDDNEGDVDFAAAFEAAFASAPSATHAAPQHKEIDEPPVELDLEEIEEIEPLEDAEPLNDAGAFVMVGEAGALFPADGPLSRSTRMYPAQALQVAADADSSIDESAVDESEVDESEVDKSEVDENSHTDSALDESDEATNIVVRGELAADRPDAFNAGGFDLDNANDCAPAASPFFAAPAQSAVEPPRTEMIDAVDWRAWSNEGSNGATRPAIPVVPDMPRLLTPPPSPAAPAHGFAPTMPAIPVMPALAPAPRASSPSPRPLSGPSFVPPPPPAAASSPRPLSGASFAPPPPQSLPVAAPAPAPAPVPSAPEPPERSSPVRAAPAPAPPVPSERSSPVRAAPAPPAPPERSSPVRAAPAPPSPAPERSSPVRAAPVALPPSSSSATMVSPLSEMPDLAPATTVGADVFEQSVPRVITGLYAKSPTPAEVSELVVEAPAGATVALNGSPMGTVADSGRLSVEVAGDARVVVRVTLAGFAPWSSVVSVLGRPRVRVRAVLAARP